MIRSLQSRRHSPTRDQARRNSWLRRQDQLRQSHEDEDWRQAAQMLSEADELLLLSSPGADTTDVAPVRSDREPSLRPRARGRPQQQQQLRRPLLIESPTPTPTPTSNEPDELRQLADDSSSISFAQSGCHSILSAWRHKAARLTGRHVAQQQQQHQQQRPLSVLSNASSIGKKSAASTAFTMASRKSATAQGRIPLGPRQAQHFVTNSRRRRRANELILSTLEARRRALALNRQNLGSLFGSESYLVDPDELIALGQQADREQEQQEQPDLLLADDYQRLSLSPSPAGLRSKTPSPAAFARPRAALSDLGSPNQRTSNGVPSSAVQAQRNRLLALTKRQAATKGRKSAGRPPLAKLDQNSSDLCSSSNCSSSGDSASSSEHSKFTQLVTSDLAPGCVLLDEQALEVRRRLGGGRARPAEPEGQFWPTVAAESQEQQIASMTSTTTASQRPKTPPKPPERTRRSKSKSPAEQQAAERRQPQRQSNKQVVVERPSDDDERGAKLRRGALRRDSIRRLRLSRAQQQATRGDNTSSSEAPETAPQPPRPLSKARKLDIESNPFLNRHHFRSLSTRSNESGQLSGRNSRQEPSREHWRSSSIRQRVTSNQEAADNSPPARDLSRPSSASRVASRRAPSQDRAEPGARRPDQNDTDGVRQVEQLLRQMQPSQRLSSHSREVSSSRSQMSSSRERPAAPPRSFSPSKLHSSTSTTTRPLVREGSRLRDDLSFDTSGNRRQIELEERWRHEQVLPSRLADGSVFSEEKLFSERVERLRSSQISPPPEFADTFAPPSRTPRTTTTTTTAATTLRAPALPPRPPVERREPETRLVRQPVLERPRSKSPAAPTRASPVPGPRQPSEERRPPPPSQGRPSGRSEVLDAPKMRLGQLPSGRPRLEKIESRPVDGQRLLAASLPKFERTADDEFKKRVDELRRMARANLAELEPLVASARPRQPLTRPQSTNWRGPEESPALASPPPRASSRPTSPQVAATNLDEMLLADRYQRPLGAWHRSNSSLASLGPRQADQQRPASPFGTPKPLAGLSSGGSVLSQSQMSIEPRGDPQASLMRVVIREKSAPRLDYAFVEQRPPVERARPAETGLGRLPVQSARPQQQTQAQTKPMTVAPPTMRLSIRSQQVIHAQPSEPPRTVRGPAARRVPSTSPRSPDFGTMAGSSNDDSAIASSVSSPSLSFMTQPTARAPSAGKQLAGLRPPTAGEESPPSGPQSILRRQQLALAAESCAAGQAPVGELAALKRPQSPQASQPLLPTLPPRQFGASGTDAGRPHPSSSSGGQQPSASSASSSSPPKRVHFNDRTSVRSFESVSSLNSNSTAVPAELVRQQVGSPDSMGSGSTSRLSGESPDLRKGSGAAIYAVRGDPELEVEPEVQQVGAVQARPRPLQQQVACGRQPAPMPVPRPVQGPPVQPPAQPSLRMTAPPSISTNTPPRLSGHLLQQQQQQRAQLQLSAHAIAQANAALQQQQVGAARGPEEDEEDPNYALRLRRAATSRVFSFGQPQIHSPGRKQAGGPQPRLQAPGGGGAGNRPQTRGVPLGGDLLNFQTEV